jgi:hypothetical protein
VIATDGFIDHGDQYAELHQGKHTVLNCVDCHDPHQGVEQLRQAKTATIRNACENCHYKEARNQKILQHDQMACIECHMPRVTRSAWGDSNRFMADVRTHLMAIDSTQINQFTQATSPDGKQVEVSLPQLGLDFVCRHCHVQNSTMAIDDATLIQAASGYHAAPPAQATPPK